MSELPESSSSSEHTLPWEGEFTPLKGFLANLRLLGLTHKPDTPRITAELFTAEDTPENKKVRIRFTEWALYHLLSLWNPEKAREKLKPLYPAQSPLQSVKLRNEFYRGVMSMDWTNIETFAGIDPIQKLFIDCKGESFEKLLFLLSSKVIVKVTEMVAQAYETVNAPTPSGSEQKSLLSPATPHHASQSNLLKKKKSQRGSFNQMNDHLNKKKAEVLSESHHAIRGKKISHRIDARGMEQYAREAAELTKQFDTNWEVDPKWKEIILEGKKIKIPDELLDHPFPKGGLPVVGSANRNASTSHQPKQSEDLDEPVKAEQVKLQPNLLEDLDKRVKAQGARLERCNNFLSKEFISSASKDGKDSEPSKQSENEFKSGTIDGPRCDTSDGRRRGTFGAPRSGTFVGPTHSTLSGPSPRRGSVTERVEEYEKLMEIINKNHTGVNQPKEASMSVAKGKIATLHVGGPSGYTLSYKSYEKKPDGTIVTRSEGEKEVADPHARLQKSYTSTHAHGDGKSQSSAEGAAMSLNSSERDLQTANAPPPEKKSTVTGDKADRLPKNLTQLTMSGSPSTPKLPSPLMYLPSLVDRTRASIALAKAEDKVENINSQSKDVPTVPIRVPGSVSSGSNLKYIGSETLVERTRKSMSLLPVKSRAFRTSLSKKPSKAYPINPFETPEKSHAEMPEVTTPPEDLFGLNAKYTSVFKSRPKIALSSAQSPSLGCMGVVYEAENNPFKGDKVGLGTGGVLHGEMPMEVLDGADFIYP